MFYTNTNSQGLASIGQKKRYIKTSLPASSLIAAAKHAMLTGKNLIT